MSSAKQNHVREIKHILLTGYPGIGKTTLIKKICNVLTGRNITAKGFYTEEVSEDGKRIGFDVCTLDGRRGQLARLRSSQTGTTVQEHFVGQYAVNLKSFEELALPVLDPQEPSHIVIVIDEIGKMELFSKKFQEKVLSIFNSTDNIVLGTIPVRRHRPILFVEDLRKRQDVQVITVDYNNRNHLEKELAEMLISSCQK